MEIFNDLILVKIEDQDIFFLTCAKVTQARPTNKYKTGNIYLLFIFVLCSVMLHVISRLEKKFYKKKSHSAGAKNMRVESNFSLLVALWHSQ